MERVDHDALPRCTFRRVRYDDPRAGRQRLAQLGSGLGRDDDQGVGVDPVKDAAPRALDRFERSRFVDLVVQHDEVFVRTIELLGHGILLLSRFPRRLQRPQERAGRLSPAQELVSSATDVENCSPAPF
jgi:hypothetical protein